MFLKELPEEVYLRYAMLGHAYQSFLHSPKIHGYLQTKHNTDPSIQLLNTVHCDDYIYWKLEVYQDILMAIGIGEGYCADVYPISHDNLKKVKLNDIRYEAVYIGRDDLTFTLRQVCDE